MLSERLAIEAGSTPSGTGSSIASANGTRTEVAEEAAVVLADRDPVGRHAPDALAVAGVAAAAGRALAAGDLERDADEVAGLDRADAASPTSITSATPSWPAGSASWTGTSPRDHQQVEVAGRDRHRAHQRLAVALERAARAPRATRGRSPSVYVSCRIASDLRRPQPALSFSRSALAASRSCSKWMICLPAPQLPSGTSLIRTQTRSAASSPQPVAVEHVGGGLVDQPGLAPLAERALRGR